MTPFPTLLLGLVPKKDADRKALAETSDRIDLLHGITPTFKKVVAISELAQCKKFFTASGQWRVDEPAGVYIQSPVFTYVNSRAYGERMSFTFSMIQDRQRIEYLMPQNPNTWSVSADDAPV